MKFGSLEEMISYIEKQHFKINQELGEEMVQVMKEEVQMQVYVCYKPESYSRTRHLMDSPQLQYWDNKIVKVGFMNMGDWTSYSGEPFFPIYGLDAGMTYGKGGYRPGTSLVDGSYNRIVSEIPKCYKSIAISCGIPIR